MRLTYGVPPLCMACKHLGVDTDPDAEAPDDVTPMSASCAAFPKGIPSETQGIPMVFQGGPRGIRLECCVPLRASMGLVEDLIVKLFIFTMFLKGF